MRCGVSRVGVLVRGPTVDRPASGHGGGQLVTTCYNRLYTRAWRRLGKFAFRVTRLRPDRHGAGAFARSGHSNSGAISPTVRSSASTLYCADIWDHALHPTPCNSKLERLGELQTRVVIRFGEALLLSCAVPLWLRPPSPSSPPRSATSAAACAGPLWISLI